MSRSSSRRASSLGSSLQDAHVQLVRRRMCVQLRPHLPEVGPEMVVVVVVPPPLPGKRGDCAISQPGRNGRPREGCVPFPSGV